jgi:hypothetical protein
VGEPDPPRHRRRERRRTGAAPPVPDEAPREYAAPAPPPPAEPVPPAADPDGAVGTAPARSTASTAAARSASAPAGAPASSPADGAEPGGEGAVRRKSRARRPDTEHGLRGIVGAGPSQVGLLGAMRARDAAKPTAADLAAAERDLEVVRRHYVPPDTLPGAR